jgi:hypothetical protein
MAAGHEQRLAAHLAAQHPAELLVTVHQWRMRACFGTWFDEPAHQFRLGHADARQVGDHAQMRGHAQPARMADAVAIDEHQIRRPRQQCQRGQQRWQLAEAEQAGDVRASPWECAHFLRHGLQCLRIQQDRCGAVVAPLSSKPTSSPASQRTSLGRRSWRSTRPASWSCCARRGDAAFPAPGVDHRIHWPQHRMGGATAR